MRGLRTFFITILIALSFNSIHSTLEEDFLESLHALLASDMPDPLRQKLHLLIVKKYIWIYIKLAVCRSPTPVQSFHGWLQHRDKIKQCMITHKNIYQVFCHPAFHKQEL